MKKALPFLTQHKKQLPLLLAAFWLIICLFATPVYTTVTLTFAEDPSGEVITTVFAGPGENVSSRDAHSRVVNSGVARISWLDVSYGSHCSLKRIDPVDTAYDAGTLTITSLTVRQNGFRTIALEGEELKTYFTGNEQVKFVSDSVDGSFTFTVTGEDPQILPIEAFQELYTSGGIGVFLAGYLGSALMLTLLYLLLRWVNRQLADCSPLGHAVGLFFVCAILILVGMTVYVGLRSPFWSNPDEYDVKAAVLYYFKHWFPPNIYSDTITDSFPVYGTTRHSEFNLFYLYAGKIGQFFSDAAVQLRLFSLLLFGTMAGITIRNFRKHYALLFVLLLTPQVWYIFSYSTSDALDFFMSFLVLYELIDEDSMLSRLCREPRCRRHILYYALLSLLFLHIFWAKITFYTVLLFTFLILLNRLFDRPKSERGALLRTYLLIVGLTLALFGIRYMITDFPYYGFNKLGAIVDVANLRGEYAYKPSTPAMEAAYSTRFFEKGIGLGEMLTQYGFHRNLFCTFAGFFGSYAFGEKDWYYLVMGLLYLALLARLTQRCIQKKSKSGLRELLSAAFCIFFQYFLIVVQSWFVDFQPQGRYALPVLFFLAYLAARLEDPWKDKVLRVILVCTALLSLYCFWHVGIPNLVPDTVNLQ